MKRMNISSSPVSWLIRVLVFAAALTVVACDNDVNFTPTSPAWPNPAPGEVGDRSLQIVGSLSAEDGSCLEATVLYDGEELADSRTTCARAKGCARLELEANVSSSSGHHTISFQVLRQSQEVIDYLAEGTVLVFRENLSLGGVSIPLEPIRKRLRPGGVVTFEIDFRD